MLGPRLRDLDRTVAAVHGLLADALHLVAEDKGIAHVLLGREPVEHHGTLDLLDGQHRIPRGMQLVDARPGRCGILPGNGLLGAESRLVDLARGRRRRDAAQDDPLHGKGVARAEKGSDVLRRTDIVEHNDDGHFRHRGELGGSRASELFIEDLAHGGTSV